MNTILDTFLLLSVFWMAWTIFMKLVKCLFHRDNLQSPHFRPMAFWSRSQLKVKDFRHRIPFLSISLKPMQDIHIHEGLVRSHQGNMQNHHFRHAELQNFEKYMFRQKNALYPSNCLKDIHETCYKWLFLWDNMQKLHFRSTDLRSRSKLKVKDLSNRAVHSISSKPLSG